MCYNVRYRKIGLRGDKVADKKRIVWIDQLRGLAFYFVVLGHMAVSGDFEAWIYSFHMPLFFIISGFNLNFDRMKETGFKDYISHIVVRMLVPYLWLQFIALGLKYAISGGLIRVPKYLLGIITGNSFVVSAPSNPLYFVLLLFSAQLLIFLLVKLTGGNKGMVFAVILALTAIPVLTDSKPAVWHINVVPTAMLFMLIGRFFMDCYVSGGKLLRRMKLPLYIIICVLLLVAGGALGVSNGRASIHANGFGEEYIIFVIGASLTSMGFALLVMLLPSTKLFNFIGMNTIFLLGIHEPLLIFTQKLFPVAWEKWWFVAIASVVCYLLPVPVAWVLNKAAPYICAMAPKESNLLIKISKFVALSLVLLAPYISFTRTAFGGALSSGGGMTALAIAIFALVVVGLERLFTLLLPFFFLENKKEKKIEQSKKASIYEDEDIMIVMPVEEV